jgi:hypothetical protein
VKALAWHGKHDIRCESVPDPRIECHHKTACVICGSDLHIYNGITPRMKSGDVLGHENMGEVVEVGADNKKLKVGDRVVVPFTIACGECSFCKNGFFSGCERTNPDHEAASKLWATHPPDCSATRTFAADMPAAISRFIFLRPSRGAERLGCHRHVSDAGCNGDRFLRTRRHAGYESPAITGIIDEGEEIIDEYEDSPALDAGLIGAAQAVEHYEIARYGTLKAWAKELGLEEAVSLLDETLAEEKSTDEKLSNLAESAINQRGEAAA